VLSTLGGHRSEMGKLVILPKIRDPRFITVRGGGTLQDDDHRLLAMWAAACAEHVLHHFEQARPKDDRPRRAIDLGRAWARGEITWWEARTAAGHAQAAARELSGAARHAAFAAGQAAAVGHVAAHELGAAAYAIKAERAASAWKAGRRMRCGTVLRGASVACPVIVSSRGALSTVRDGDDEPRLPDPRPGTGAARSAPHGSLSPTVASLRPRTSTRSNMRYRPRALRCSAAPPVDEHLCGSCVG
jgi:hypothetical protein